MLRLGAEASTADLNGRGAPDGPLEDGERRCRAGVTDPNGRFRQEIGFLMLFRDGPQGYLPLGSPLDGPQSGECRLSLHQGATFIGNAAWPEDFRACPTCSPTCIIPASGMG